MGNFTRRGALVRVQSSAILNVSPKRFEGVLGRSAYQDEVVSVCLASMSFSVHL